jgi:hypothetical protein
MGVDDGKLLLSSLLLPIDEVSTSAGGFTQMMKKENMAVEMAHPRHRIGRGFDRSDVWIIDSMIFPEGVSWYHIVDVLRYYDQKGDVSCPAFEFIYLF